MEELHNKREGVLTITNCTRPNGQRLSFVATDRGPICFRRSPSSIWEPLGQENMGIAMAINHFGLRDSKQ